MESAARSDGTPAQPGRAEPEAPAKEERNDRGRDRASQHAARLVRFEAKEGREYRREAGL